MSRCLTVSTPPPVTAASLHSTAWFSLQTPQLFIFKNRQQKQAKQKLFLF